jgi:hypothetical protein
MKEESEHRNFLFCRDYRKVATKGRFAASFLVQCEFVVNTKGYLELPRSSSLGYLDLEPWLERQTAGAFKTAKRCWSPV